MENLFNADVKPGSNLQPISCIIDSVAPIGGFTDPET